MSIKNFLRNVLYKNGIGKSIWYTLHTININVLRVLPNETYFKRAYKKTHGVDPNFKDPQTFDEKQLWLKMNYRNPLCTKCSDKYLVREYIKECGLEHILNPIYGVYDSVDDIKWEELPDRFYIKANHMSACNVRCNNLATFEKKTAVKKLARGMKHDYSLDSREWNYHDIDRKIIAEAIIENQDGSGLIDYRFLCSYGNCDYLFVDIDTADENGTHRTDARRNVYDKDFNLMDVKVSRPNFEPSFISKPSNFDEMLKYAQILSKPFPFCRVDFYNVDGKIIFGEITFFHAGGLSKVTPKEWEIKLGDIINLKELLK
ncbi:MAG: carboxylate--amine ligase [Clostridia bacterium]|nr:carboxylate--amine ligase [Clostridia bacterium]